MLEAEMLALIIIFAILAAFFNAWSGMIQRYEAGEPEMEELFRGELSKKLFKDIKWIGALGLQVVAFLCQAAALKRGSLLVVEPLLTIDLVFLLLLLHFRKGVDVGKREWLAILLICTGLSGMLAAAGPKAGQRSVNLFHLMLTSIIIAGVIAIGIYLVRRTHSRNYRAAISAVAAGFSFALVAVFTKLLTRELSHGVLATLSSWQLWALFASGIVSLVMIQNTYGAGPVAISQPTMEIVEPIISIVLGIFLFGDSVNLDATSLFFATTFGALTGTGITLLARSKRLQLQRA